MSTSLENKKFQDKIKKATFVSKKDRGIGLSPMSPPLTGDDSITKKISIDQYHSFFYHLHKEHVLIKEKLSQVLQWQDILKKEHEHQKIKKEQRHQLKELLENIKNILSIHHLQEEEKFFPLLKKKFLEKGEHSKGKQFFTGIEILTQEHDDGEKILKDLLFDIDYADENGLEKKMIRAMDHFQALMELHISREDNILFGLAMEWCSLEELNSLL